MNDWTTQSTVKWTHKPAGELESIGAEDGSILILPVGSVEQHGHHLPVGTDSMLVDAVATLGAERVDSNVPIVVGPTLWSGFSPHHLSLGGTLSVDHRTLLTLLEDVTESAIENGFDAVLLLNGHGGNAALITCAVSTIGRRHPDTEVLGLTYFDLAKPFADELRESDSGGMAHGGEFETSLMLALHPELVDQEGNADATYWDEVYEQGTTDLLEPGPLSVYRPFEEYSGSGAIGAPELASAEKGKALLDGIGDELERLLRSIHANNRD